MTESIDDLPPITPNETALMWSSFEHIVRVLIIAHALRAGGLHIVRLALKDGTWFGMPAHLEGRRLVLLADVCTAISKVDVIPLDYFRLAGDVPEVAPDDAAGIA